ncbi:MAG: DUF4012 domain-containing protein [Actinomycetota bacterium]
MTTSTQTPAETPGETDRTGSAAPHDRGTRRSVIRWVLALLAAVLAATVIATVIIGLDVQRDAEDAKVEMAKGRRALAAGDLATALDRFSAAEAGFGRARASATQGIGGLVAAIPIIGRSMDVAAGISDAGVTLAGAAVDLTTALEQLPDGLGSLAPAGGRIPVETLTELADDVEAAAADAKAALEAVRETPSTLLPAVVAEARFQAEEQVVLASRALDSATLLMRGLPTFAGADGQRRYMLLAESPSEQRGTGGIWGAYAILTADEGELSVGPFAPILSLPEARPDQIPAPNPDYRRNYDQYGGAGSWRDLNMTPDFPSAARAALSTYEHGTGERLDGVIVADPFALEELLRVSGPLEIPSLGVTVNARSVVRFVSNEAYILFPGQGKERKGVLGAVVGGAFDRFLTGRGEPLAKVRAITRAVAGGHLKLYTTDPTVERGLRLANLDGGLRAPDGDDLLAVHINSRSASKVDYYVDRTVTYDVTLGGEGEAIATTEITLRNDAPTEGVPGFVIDPGEGIEGHQPGDNVSIVTSSCPSACELVEARLGGRDVALRVGEELGRPWYQAFYTTPGGESSTLEVVTRRSAVWAGNSSGGTYRLTILPQTTIEPTEIVVDIRPPAGTEIVWTSEPMTERDGGTVWRGEPEGRVELVVRFRAPLPLRWWRNVERAVS